MERMSDSLSARESHGHRNSATDPDDEADSAAQRTLPQSLHLQGQSFGTGRAAKARSKASCL
eukprot:4274715-Alexandrium_andersonii.AAC.1